LQKLFAAFPAGWPGIGLICLRVAVAIALLTHGVAVLSAAEAPAFRVWTMESVAILVGVALLIGLLTPLVGAAAAICYLYVGTSQLLGTGNDSHGSTAWCLAIISIALVLLGPGAFSLDARLFGLRQIMIPDPPRQRSNG
jgi:uncharacterized membrane protein YphA (DoxX/SURF4 family)